MGCTIQVNWAKVISPTGPEIKTSPALTFETLTSQRVHFQVHFHLNRGGVPCSLEAAFVRTQLKQARRRKGEIQINYRKWTLNLMISQQKQNCFSFVDESDFRIECAIKFVRANFLLFWVSEAETRIIYDLFSCRLFEFVRLWSRLWVGDKKRTQRWEF